MKLGFGAGAVLAALVVAILAAPTKALDVHDSQSTAQGTVVDDSDPGWTWSGFVEYDDPGLHGGTAHAGGSPSYAVYSFTGTGIDVYVMGAPTIAIDGRRHRVGNMQVSIDGHLKGDVPTQKPDVEYDVEAFSATGLSSGVHVLKIDPEDGWVAVDYVRVHTGDDETPQGPGSDVKKVTKTTAGPPVTIPEGDYRIYPRIAPGSDLDDKDWKTADGNAVQIWKDGDHQKNQWFHLTPLGNGEYWFAPQVASTEAVTMLTPQDDSVVPAGIWQFTQNPAQIWMITTTPDGWCRISPSNAPSLALTVQGGLVVDGTPVICDTWQALPQQDWAIGVQ